MSLEGKATGKTPVGRIQQCDVLTISAYGVAVQNGFEGTVEEWLASLKGEKGDKGDQGIQGVRGEKGDKGDTGKSAYEHAKDGGYGGTEAEFAGEVAELPVAITEAYNSANNANQAAERANAYIETARETLDAIRDIVSSGDEAPAIICEESGEMIAVRDASNRLLHSLTLYGKTTQNGTPSPDSPVPLVSVGDEGSIGVTVAGKNLHDLSKVYGYNKLFPLILPAGTPITFSTYPSAGTSQLNAEVLYSDGTKDAFNIVGSYGANGVWHTRQFTPTKDTASYMLYDVTSSTKRTIDKLMLRIGNFDATTDADYEPYKETQTLTAATPNGLPGIPAASGGNYTDENGQAWVCDEIDFARGKYLQRVKRIIFDGSIDEAWTANTLNRFSIALPDVEYPVNNDIKGTGLSNALTMTTANKIYENPSEVAMALNAVSKMFFIRVSTTFTTVDELRAWLSANPLTVLLIAANTIETDLSAEELDAFAALCSNKPNTTVYTDSNAGIRLEYQADTKTYIDNKFTALAAAIVNNA